MQRDACRVLLELQQAGLPGVVQRAPHGRRTVLHLQRRAPPDDVQEPVRIRSQYQIYSIILVTIN